MALCPLQVIRHVDGLDLALNRRFHELQDLYKMIKLKQSLLEKGENRYNIRWKEHQAITANLKKTKALRKLDQKHRNTIDKLLWVSLCAVLMMIMMMVTMMVTLW